MLEAPKKGYFWRIAKGEGLYQKQEKIPPLDVVDGCNLVKICLLISIGCFRPDEP